MRISDWSSDVCSSDLGTILKNPELAQFLETLAARGADYFYIGPPAQDLVQTVRTASRNPSPMTLGDLASYDAKERPPVCGMYREYRICGMGPPSSRSEEHTSELQSLMRISYAVFCLKKKKQTTDTKNTNHTYIHK